MRVMLLALLLAVVGAGVALALDQRDEEGSFYGWRPHPPETAEEKAAAASASAYVRAILAQRADRACEHAAGATFRRLRCARAQPRIPRGLQLSTDGRVSVYHVNVRGATASVELSNLVPGPAHAFTLQRLGGTWRVFADDAFARA